MKRATVLIRPKAHYRQEAFCEGLRRLGYDVRTGHDGAIPDPADVLVTWNRTGTAARAAEQFEAAGAAVIVCENGYCGADEKGRRLYAMALGGHNGAGVWPSGGPERWDALGIEVAAWRRTGRHILICPQRGIGPPATRQPSCWTEAVMARLRVVTDRPLVVRSHPGRLPALRSLAWDLRDCWAVVVWASNCATHALIAGVPVFFEGPYMVMAGAAVRGTRWIEAPPRDEPTPLPMRHATFRRLAWAQWRVAEIASGEAVARLLACR